tara:strand:- start:187 stop:459 length:273 start_codon:yes stop_codon:yes gene_type:complete
MRGFSGIPIYKKVSWYEEDLHDFYDTDKDNNGYIYGIYLYEDIEFNPFPESLEWFKTEEERDSVFDNILRTQARLCCLNGILTGKEEDSG